MGKAEAGCPVLGEVELPEIDFLFKGFKVWVRRHVDRRDVLLCDRNSDTSSEAMEAFVRAAMQ